MFSVLNPPAEVPPKQIRTSMSSVVGAGSDTVIHAGELKEQQSFDGRHPIPSQSTDPVVLPGTFSIDPSQLEIVVSNI